MMDNFLSKSIRLVNKKKKSAKGGNDNITAKILYLIDLNILYLLISFTNTFLQVQVNFFGLRSTNCHLY